MPSLVQEMYPPHLLAQKLNNRGALCIQKGRYQEAINTFVKALKLSEQSAHEISCKCRHCSMDACLNLSSTNVCDEVKTSSPPLSITSEHPAKRQKMEHSAASSPFAITRASSMDIDDIDSSTETCAESSSSGYIYGHAIQVHPYSIENAHNMGVTLSLIIIFNLALSHHRMGTMHGADKRYLKKALQLYELAYQLHVDEQQAQIVLERETKRLPQDPSLPKLDPNAERMGVLRFTMIVSNNLGEIHRVAGNSIKHHMCLQHLLSTIMYVVDGHVRDGIGGNMSNSSATGSNITTSSRNDSITSEELDGFLRNTAAIMIHDICASAA